MIVFSLEGHHLNITAVLQRERVCHVALHVSTVAQSGQTSTGSIEDLSMLPVFLASSTGEITYHGKLFYCMMSSVTLRKLSKA